ERLLLRHGAGGWLRHRRGDGFGSSSDPLGDAEVARGRGLHPDAVGRWPGHRPPPEVRGGEAVDRSDAVRWVRGLPRGWLHLARLWRFATASLRRRFRLVFSSSWRR